MARRRGKKGGGPSGVLPVDKPGGITSHDAVQKIRRVLGGGKVGHGGTLDPLATGALPILVGQATRLAPFAAGLEKAYRTTMKLGVTTDTLDAEGTVVETRPVGPEVTQARLRHLVPSFVGEIDQLPPMYSAVRIDGKRLYELAREGTEVERTPRRVVIHRIDVEGFEPDAHEATLSVICGKGVYIRQLVADLGEALGCGAHVTALRRTRVGQFGEPNLIPLDELGDLSAITAALIPPLRCVEGVLPIVALTEPTAAAVRQGQRPEWSKLGSDPLPPGVTFAFSLPPDELVAIAQMHEVKTGAYGLTRVFPRTP